jgi:hypothetical protein
MERIDDFVQVVAQPLLELELELELVQGSEPV